MCVLSESSGSAPKVSLKNLVQKGFKISPEILRAVLKSRLQFIALDAAESWGGASVLI